MKHIFRQLFVNRVKIIWVDAKIAFYLAILSITACSHVPTTTPSVSGVDSHIDKAYNSLSGSDAKAVLIESWIK